MNDDLVTVYKARDETLLTMNLTGVKRLSLEISGNVTQAGIRALARWPLTNLELSDSFGVSDGVLDPLGSMTSLEDLRLSCFGLLTDISTAPFIALKNLRILQFLWLYDLGDETCRVAGQLSLDELLVEYSDISDRGMTLLAQSSTLRKLRLGESHDVTDAGLEALARTAAPIEELSLEISATDRGIEALAELPKLRYLKLFHRGSITRSAMRRLQAARPNLVVEEYVRGALTDTDLRL
jgi:hypothetical protein